MDSNAMKLYQSAHARNCPAAVEAVQAGAELSCHDHAGLTPLHIAAMKGDADMVQLLVQLRAQVDVGDGNESTPLHYAVQAQHLNAVSALVHGRASLTCKLREGAYAGASPVDLAQALAHQSAHADANLILGLLNRTAATRSEICERPWWAAAVTCEGVSKFGPTWARAICMGRATGPKG